MNRIEELADVVMRHRRIVIFLGDSGQRAAQAALRRAAERLAERVSGYVLRTPDTPNYALRGQATDFGAFSFAATPETAEVVAYATLVLAVENPLRAFATRDGTAFQGKTVIHCGAGRPDAPSCRVDDHLTGDAVTLLRQLEAELGRRLRSRRGRAARHTPAIFRLHPRAVLRTLSDELGKRSMLFMDVTVAGLPYAQQELHVSPTQVYDQDIEKTGCMGVAFGKSIGARYAACREVDVACVIGDGGFRMVNSGELHALSISGLGAGYVLLVLENGGYQFVKQGVEAGGLRVAGEVIGTYDAEHKPDFTAAGPLWCCESERVTSIAHLRRALRRAFLAAVPVILEVPIDAAFAAPIGDRSAAIAKLFGTVSEHFAANEPAPE